MLAQNFKTAADLGIRNQEWDALVKVLGMLERGEIDAAKFTMASVGEGCGSLGCLMGWAKYVSADLSLFDRLHDTADTAPLHDLFMFCIAPSARITNRMKVKPEQAAIALRSYLSTGKANWTEALA